jgi:3-phosphoshikimate 1-carboxyvinyltransferase
MLSEFCVDLSMTDDGYYKASEPRITAPKTCSFEADYSYVANFIAANYIMTGRTSSPIHFFGDAPVEQPDYLIHDLIFQSDTTVRNCPDLFPILCVSALKRRGDTVLREISRLKQKESNRVESTAQMIKALGGRVDMFNDRVVIHGTGGRLAGGTVDSFGDHRIVMAAAVAALMCDNSIMIKNAGVVEKSAPKFFDDFVKLGGTVHEYVRE